MYNKLKTVMAERHITGYALAKMTGITSSNIYRALNGKVEFFTGWKKRIADALNVPIDELFDEEKGGEDDE